MTASTTTTKGDDGDEGEKTTRRKKEKDDDERKKKKKKSQKKRKGDVVGRRCGCDDDGGADEREGSAEGRGGAERGEGGEAGAAAAAGAAARDGEEEEVAAEDGRPSPSSSSSGDGDGGGDDGDDDFGEEEGQQQRQEPERHEPQKPHPPTSPATSPSPSPLSFRNLDYLSRGVFDFLSARQFDDMTPVQAATIPLFLRRRKDVAVRAVTGSGKTLAFLIPAVETCASRNSASSSSSSGSGGGNSSSGSSSSSNKLKRNQIGALILSPTRELAMQTHAVASELCRHCQQPPPLLLVGGGGGGGGGGGSKGGKGGGSGGYRPVGSDLRQFRELGCDIVIGTPGRVQDVLTKYDVVDCTELDLLILDEADVLLNMGFADALETILGRLPKMRRTGLFSATSSSATATSSSSSSLGEWMRRVGMRNPVWIDVAVNATPAAPTSAANSNSNAYAASGASANASSEDGDDPQERQKKKKQVAAVRRQATPTSLTNYYVVCPPDEKLSRLAEFLREHRREKVIVFFLTCACVEFFGGALRRLFENEAAAADAKAMRDGSKAAAAEAAAAPPPAVRVETMHGRMVQKRREKTMERFRNGGGGGGDGEAGDPATGCTGTGGGGVGGALFCTDVAARGLDVTDVEWVVQFDAPQDPNFYVHRVGRSARAGRTGKSLLFLAPKEEAYVDLLRLRNVPLQPLPPTERCCPPQDDDEGDDKAEKEYGAERGGGSGGSAPAPRVIRSAAAASSSSYSYSGDAESTTSIPDVLPKLRDLVMTDRDLLEKGTKAYTSYIRAYKEHHCAFIFRFASLDLGLLATSFCLLRLPKMPELRDVLQRHKGRLPHFVPASSDVNIFAIPFKDKVREKARQKRLEAELAVGDDKKKNSKQIRAEQKRAEKERKAAERREAAIAKGRNPDKKRGRQAQLVDEWDDLAKEERLHKKLRKKKITQQQFDDEMYGAGA